MSREDLEKDLMNNAYDRLAQWEVDTASRMEAVDIPLKHAAMNVASILVWELCRIAVTVGLKPEYLHRAIDEALNSERMKQFKTGLQGRQSVKGVSDEGGR